MSTLIAFMISIMAGIISDIARLTKRLVFVRSRFASSKRRSSLFSAEKARITGIPVRISREIRFIRSIFDCSTRKRGMTNAKSTPISAARAPTPTARIHERYDPVWETRIRPPIARIGA